MMISIENNSNAKIVLILFAIFLGCTSKNQNYYYAYYSDKGSTPESYIIKKVTNGKYRNETDYMFTASGELKSKFGNIFKVSDMGLEKIIKIGDREECKDYLTIKNNEWVNFYYPNESLNDFASTRFCFLGRDNIVLNNKEYTGTYKFKKEFGSANGVLSIIYFDKNFIPILEEFIEGERPYFRIERLEKKLDFIY